jgi:N-acetyl-1-D-myo-inositol-2-amino-2-deoxy-alpha-D-glucopyranoside deacetylase
VSEQVRDAEQLVAEGFSGAGRRMLLVHAHPDDETINNGATMARYAAEGAQVTLITCTRGEQGEVIPPELAHLVADAEGGLGTHRETELAAAMATLGVKDHRFLDDAGLGGDVPGDAVPGRAGLVGAGLGGAVPGVRFVDSGMALDHEGRVVPAPGIPENAFTAADPKLAAELLARVLREVRPHVVITYEPGGGYGHPDHVRAHEVTMRACELSTSPGLDGDPGWAVPKVYWAVMPLSLARAALMAMAQAPDRPTGLDPDGRLPSMVIPDEQVTTCIDAVAFAPAKAAALRAHRTQVAVTDDDAFFCLSNNLYQPIMGLEFYRLVRGDPAGPFDDLGRETDLFAGL